MTPEQDWFNTLIPLLPPAELLKQVELTLQIGPASQATQDFKRDLLTVIEWKNLPNWTPFSEGVEITNLPDYMERSYTAWKILTPEIQQKISYYQKNGEWFANIDGTKISMKNEQCVWWSALDTDIGDVHFDKKQGVFKATPPWFLEQSYFTQPAAIDHAKRKGMSLPTNDMWMKMAETLGWFKQLRDILQIPLVGYCPDGDLSHDDVGLYTAVWSADQGDYLRLYTDSGNVGGNYNDWYGLGVRLLDK